MLPVDNVLLNSFKELIEKLNILDEYLSKMQNSIHKENIEELCDLDEQIIKITEEILQKNNGYYRKLQKLYRNYLVK